MIINIDGKEIEIEDKTRAAVATCITWRTLTLSEELNQKYINIVTKTMIHDLFSLIGDDWTISDINEYRPDLQKAIGDICFLQAIELITAKHSKEILKAIWALPYLEVASYILDSKILEEAEGDELLAIVQTVVKNNPKTVSQILEGKDKAIGFLVGQVMKAAKGKANPQQAQEMLREEMKGDD